MLRGLANIRTRRSSFLREFEGEGEGKGEGNKGECESERESAHAQVKVVVRAENVGWKEMVVLV